jgi:hypothetical protein
MPKAAPHHTHQLRRSKSILIMPGQSSIVVCKPQVVFSGRRKDKELQALTVKQLRQRARTRGLDVSRLTEKWEFVHVLIESEFNIQPYIENVVDTKRLTITDLPGEIRNKIYAYLLVNDNPITIRYGDDRSLWTPMEICRWYAVRASRSYPRGMPPVVVQQLMAMSWASRELRAEVRPYFFKHNVFKVRGSHSASYTTFLDKIGPVGRANIAVLDLDDRSFRLYNYLPHLIEQCTSLRVLEIRMHIKYLLDTSTYAALRSCIIKDEPSLRDLMETPPGFNGDSLPLLPTLQALTINCVYREWQPLHWPLDTARWHRDSVVAWMMWKVEKHLEALFKAKRAAVSVWVPIDADRRGV